MYMKTKTWHIVLIGAIVGPVIGFPLLLLLKVSVDNPFVYPIKQTIIFLGRVVSDTDRFAGLEAEKERWTGQGWSYVETFGASAADATYASHMSSPTARLLTAFASDSGVRTNKIYAQTNGLYLVVSMQRPSGDTFALVFTKPK